MFRTALAAFASFTLGCAPPTNVAPHHGRSLPSGKSDQISPNDDPSGILPNVSMRLGDTISTADVGQTFGTDDAHIPYPDTYWPFTSDGIDSRWSGAQSPLEKYMALVDANNLSNAKQWEHGNHGSGVSGVQGWWGHCPGWTGAALSNAPLLHSAWAKSDGQGGITGCAQGDASCTEFQIGDINALEAEVWVDGNDAFIGARCDTAPAQIQRDASGRIVRSGNGCQGLNAGSLLVVAANLMKGQNLPFAIDAQNDYNTDQIWNQPAYRYTVNRFETIDAATAANLVAHGTRTGDQTSYAWNSNAMGFAYVDLTLNWVSELGPNSTPISGASSTNTTRVTAVIELDADPSDPNANIIGGEYTQDANAGSDRLTVPPFVWISTGPGPEQLDPSASGNSHNPYVRPSLVLQLVSLAQQ